MTAKMTNWMPALRHKRSQNAVFMTVSLRIGVTRSQPSTAEVHHHLVDEAPAPVLSRFERSHDRMLCRPKMLRRMLVFRIVAAADVAARSAEAEMHPCVAQGEALLAARGIGAVR